MFEQFIEQKSQQLIYYVSRFFRGQLPYAELRIFIWDTLEEWSQLDVRDKAPETMQEQVFWHLLHQLEYWPEQELKQNKRLKRALQHCLAFLCGKATVPSRCVGVRP
jgi:hypothetical protein